MDIREKYKLPKAIKVEVKVTPEGYFFAQLPKYKGCFTEAKDIYDLIVNVNDAILTYFDVSREDAQRADFIYMPPLIPKEIKPINTLVKIQNSGQEFKSPALIFKYFTSQQYGNSSSLRG